MEFWTMIGKQLSSTGWLKRTIAVQLSDTARMQGLIYEEISKAMTMPTSTAGAEATPCR